MKIHTNNPNAVRRAIQMAAADLPGVYVETTLAGSRSHSGAVNLKMEGTSNRKVNAGTARNVDRSDLPNAATWDEWGVVLAAVFDADRYALAGSVKHPIYRNAEHYHYATGWRFEKGLPADAHQDHRWAQHPAEASGWQKCTKCSAEKPSTTYLMAWGAQTQ